MARPARHDRSRRPGASRVRSAASPRTAVALVAAALAAWPVVAGASDDTTGSGAAPPAAAPPTAAGAPAAVTTSGTLAAPAAHVGPTRSAGPAGAAIVGAARQAARDLGAGQGAPVARPLDAGGSGPTATPLGSAGAVDAVGDAWTPRGDIVQAATSASGDGIVTSAVQVAQYDDPYGPNWESGDTGIIWYYDTDGVGAQDFLAVLLNGNGTVAGVVLEAATLTPLCLATVGVGAAPAIYSLAFPHECLGKAPDIRWAVEMDYEDVAAGTSGFDTLPDDPTAWLGPVVNDAVPTPSTTTSTPTTTTQPPPTSVPPTDPVAGGATRFRAVAPARLVDTRGSAACTQTVQVAGAGGVPPEATAAALTITVPAAGAPGYGTVWPAGGAQPDASNVNYGTGETRANSSIVQLGAGGAVDVATSTCEAVIVDVTGAFVPTSTAAAAGRFVAVAPHRVMDVQTEGSALLTLPLAQLGVPAGATAVAVNVTIDRSGTGGYLTAWPGGEPQPGSSMLNADGPGQTRAAAAIVPLGGSGLNLWQNMGGRLIVDVTGWFTGEGDAVSASGLFVPASPVRLLDTRPARISGWTDVPGLPAGAAAIAANVTITDPAAAGWLTAAPGGQGDVNATSTVNAAKAGESIANFTVVPVGTGVAVAAGGTDAAAIVDLAGSFTA